MRSTDGSRSPTTDHLSKKQLLDFLQKTYPGRARSATIDILLGIKTVCCRKVLQVTTANPLCKIIYSLVLVALTASSALADSVRYDPVYDQKARSLSTVACSNGPNGLLTCGYKMFGDLSSFPNIGGASAVKGWNSGECGSCWQLTFVNTNGSTKSINVTAVDYTASGFNIALTAMNDLTGGHGVEYGVVEVQVTKVNPSGCGFKAT